MRNLARALSAVLILEILVLLFDILPVQYAAPLLVVTEATAFVLGGSILLKAVKKVRASMKKGERLYFAIEAYFEDVLPPKALFMVKHEMGVFASLFRWIGRNKDLPDGATEIPYGKPLRQLMIVLLMVGILEIAAIHLLIPWRIPRIILLILSIYSLFWIIGLLASTIVYPHYVTGEALVIRFFHYHTISIPLSQVKSVESATRTAPENKTLLITDDALYLNVLGSTNCLVSYNAPQLALCNGRTEGPISAVFFSADSPFDAKTAIAGALLN